MSKLLYTGDDWTLEKIEHTWKAIHKIATEKYNLDYYDPQIEIVTADQMIARHASGAMPIMYHHWSFGKNFLQMKKEYQAGKSALSYETIINTNPTLAFIMEDNTMTMQALVLAHAVCGHGSFFKINGLFLRHTDADYILEYLKYAQDYIKKCEHKYGPSQVEWVLDACHALQLYGVDKSQRRRSLSKRENNEKIEKRYKQEQDSYKKVWDTIPTQPIKQTDSGKGFDWAFPEENLLYFIEKNSPKLEIWQKELVRIVRKIAQYFYPQYQTKVMNEGWASFWHHTLMTDLWDEGRISEGNYLEFLQSHTGVCCQQGLEDTDALIGFNPYALGFSMYKDIQRMCTDPTDEDRKWFPDVVDRPWLEVITEATVAYRDDSFIAQYLSPKVMRDMKMFGMADDTDKPVLHINSTQDGDYKLIRRQLADSYNFNKNLPHIEIENYDGRGNRALTLVHYEYDNIELQPDFAKATAKHVRRLWGKPIYLNSRKSDGSKDTRILTLEY